jgi:hypothetical protein
MKKFFKRTKIEACYRLIYKEGTLSLFLMLKVEQFVILYI